MTYPPLLLDAIAVLMLLRIPAALICLYKAALSMGSGFTVSGILAGPFSKWMGWTIVFITLPELLLWFSGLGLDVSATHGTVQGAWLSSFATALDQMVRDLLIKNLAKAVAAWFLMRGVFHVVHGDSPIASVLACFALLSLDSLYQLFEQYHHNGDPYATVDMVMLLWQFAAGRLAPIAAGAAAMGIVWSVANQRPWLHLAGAGLAFFSLFGLWALTKHWFGIAG